MIGIKILSMIAAYVGGVLSYRYVKIRIKTWFNS